MTILKKFKILYKKYEGYLIPIALFSGFATDILTFKLIEFKTSIFFLLGHLIFAGLNIVVINYFKDKRPENKITSFWNLFAPLFLQFSFGNIFSGFLIFHYRSGSIFASWPFLLVIISLLIGNEVVRRYDFGPEVQLGAYFFALFVYFNLAFSYIFRMLNVKMFLISGLFSLLVINLFFYFLFNYLKEVKKHKNNLYLLTAVIFLLFNFLYFTNTIPPIPLVMKEAGVYHNIEKAGDNYRGITEECQNWDQCFFSSEKIHITSAKKSIYFYSAIYLPPKMDLEVIHKWQKYNETEKKWKTEAEIPFNLKGGRDIGFRWYSHYNVTTGRWRVSVETKGGQVVGRERFYVLQGDKAKKVKEI